jgi:hypothetical protein
MLRRWALALPGSGTAAPVESRGDPPKSGLVGSQSHRPLELPLRRLI